MLLIGSAFGYDASHPLDGMPDGRPAARSEHAGGLGHPPRLKLYARRSIGRLVRSTAAEPVNKARAEAWNAADLEKAIGVTPLRTQP
ncbi:hypothetical protein GCM10010353_64950 [Streptomyces chryseus]|nr:hypothetical protein GCM10010353_64950 [Streptomyces chryseus]